MSNEMILLNTLVSMILVLIVVRQYFKNENSFKKLKDELYRKEIDEKIENNKKNNS